MTGASCAWVYSRRDGQRAHDAPFPIRRATPTVDSGYQHGWAEGRPSATFEISSPVSKAFQCPRTLQQCKTDDPLGPAIRMGPVPDGLQVVEISDLPNPSNARVRAEQKGWMAVIENAGPR